MDTDILFSFAHVWRAGADGKYWRLSMGFALVVAGEWEGNDHGTLANGHEAGADFGICPGDRVESDRRDTRPRKIAPSLTRYDFPLPPSFPFLSLGVTETPGPPFHVFPWSLPSKFDSLSLAPDLVEGKNDRTVQFARNETTVRGPITDGCRGRVPVGLRGSCSPACFLFSRN